MGTVTFSSGPAQRARAGRETGMHRMDRVGHHHPGYPLHPCGSFLQGLPARAWTGTASLRAARPVGALEEPLSACPEQGEGWQAV